jgi:hypothetical protein
MNIGHEKTKQGEVIYAELMPATPLLIWYGFTRKGWCKFWPWASGRTWKEPLTFWWYEILSESSPVTPDNPFGAGTHHYHRDGGAMTLRQAIWKAHEAVSDAVIDVEADAKSAKPADNTDKRD